MQEDKTAVVVPLFPDVNKRSLTRLFFKSVFHLQSINAMSVTFSRAETRQWVGKFGDGNGWVSLAMAMVG